MIVLKYSNQHMSKLSQSGLVQMGVRFTPDLAVEVKIHCAKNRLTIRDFVAQATVEKLAKEKAA